MAQANLLKFETKIPSQNLRKINISLQSKQTYAIVICIILVLCVTMCQLILQMLFVTIKLHNSVCHLKLQPKEKMLLLSVKCNKVLRRTLHWMCVCNLTSIIVYELQVYLNENTHSSYSSLSLLCQQSQQRRNQTMLNHVFNIINLNKNN